MIVMVKVLVVYDSMSGNTEKMAHAIAEGAKSAGADVAVKRAEATHNNDLADADGIILGSPTYFGQMSAKLKALIEESVKLHKLLDGRVGGAFTSSGGTASGAETTLLSIVQAMLIHGMIVPGRSDDRHYGVAVVGTPNEEDLTDCRLLGKNVATLAKKLKV